MEPKRNYIWLPTETDDSYAEFRDVFSYDEGQVFLEITADYQFAAYVNGAFAANSQFADLPGYKAVSRYDITRLCHPGENTLTVKAHHPGQEHFQNRKMQASVSYAVLSGKDILAASTGNSLCRPDPACAAGELITPQLGLGCRYDFTAEDTPWEKASVVSTGFTEVDKPIQNTALFDMPAGPAVYGAYKLDGGGTIGEQMQRAWQRPISSMTDRFPVTVHSDSGDGIYLLCDIGEESAGYPYFCVECGEETTAWLGWGEHLTDGRIRTHIEPRSFAVEIRLKAGRNCFADYLRRIGGRYLCLYIRSKRPVTFHSAGIYEERYPFRKQEKDFGDRLLNRLYAAGQRTLELCAHQHYEDCPWREQALYGMDSRNQMLFGYGAFREYAFPRANLRLMAKCLAEDGLLDICPPSRSDITIPSFSAYWVVACYEHTLADFQMEFVQDVLSSVERVLTVFMAQTKENMVYTFGDKRYWNFHEWSDGLDGGEIHRTESIQPVPDALLTAICCRAGFAAAELEAMAGNSEKSRHFRQYADALAKGLERFFVPEKGLFASYLPDGKPEGFHEMTQALMLFTGRLSGAQKEAVVHALQNGGDIVPITLSGMAFKYEALLKYADAREYVLEDMVQRFAPMLNQGTTYWETALGQRDFDNAGSLCHGWSAVPCYVLDQLFQ